MGSVVDTRAKYLKSTLADLYNRITMPDDLKKAHNKLDDTMDKLYRKDPFKSDEDRLEFLLIKYDEMVNKGQTKIRFLNLNRIYISCLCLGLTDYTEPIFTLHA